MPLNANQRGAVVREMSSLLRITVLVLSVSLVVACDSEDDKSVVVYTSVDQNFSEPVLRAFEKKSGIRVKALYDVEAAKTTGLVNKLIAEADRPRADVFWNGELLQTLLLARKGILASYSPTLGPGQSQDDRHLLTAFGGRARVLIVSASGQHSGPGPSSLSDLLSDSWPAERLAVANPLFGTSATHAAALYAAWGDKAAGDFFRSLKARGVRFVDGNSVVRDLAVSGEIAFGLTDTDDACNARANGADVAVVFPDQEPEGVGTLVIPNTVSLIAGAPRPETGKKLVDYLLSETVMRALANSGWFHVGGQQVLADRSCGLPTRVRPMSVDSGALLDAFARSGRELREILVD